MNSPIEQLEERVMGADRKWVERNLGFDLIAKPSAPATFAFKAAAKVATDDC